MGTVNSIVVSKLDNRGNMSQGNSITLLADNTDNTGFLLSSFGYCIACFISKGLFSLLTQDIQLDPVFFQRNKEFPCVKEFEIQFIFIKKMQSENPYTFQEP